jgi:hypothetical protein
MKSGKLLFLSIMIIVFFGFFYSIQNVNAEELPEIEWIKTHSLNAGTIIKATDDGGFISIGGQNVSFNTILKLDMDGNIVWDKILNGYDVTSCEQTRDGGYILAGTKINESNNKIFYIFLMKLEMNGDEEWVRTFRNDIESDFSYLLAYSVKQTIDNGYIIAGKGNQKDFDILLLKSESEGNESWRKFYDSNGTSDNGYFVEEITNEGFLVAGSFNAKFHVFKTDLNGNMEWTLTKGLGAAHCIRQSLDGGYLVTGSFLIEGNSGYTIHLMKIDEEGHELWSQQYGEEFAGSAQYVEFMSDGGYVIAGGLSNGSGLKPIPCLIKTDQNGDQQWIRYFPQEETNVDCFTIKDVEEISNHEFILGLVSQYCVIKLNYTGALDNGPTNGDDTNGTPGFEFFFVISAIMVLFIELRKRNR